MTFSNKISELIKNDGYTTNLALYAFEAYRKKHGITSDPNGGEHNDFFADGSPFEEFLKKELDLDVIIAGCVKDRCAEKAKDFAAELVILGEKLIRRGYRISDDNSLLVHSDFLADKPRTHIVSLVGIHDDDEVDGESDV